LYGIRHLYTQLPKETQLALTSLAYEVFAKVYRIPMAIFSLILLSDIDSVIETLGKFSCNPILSSNSNLFGSQSKIRLIDRAIGDLEKIRLRLKLLGIETNSPESNYKILLSQLRRQLEFEETRAKMVRDFIFSDLSPNPKLSKEIRTRSTPKYKDTDFVPPGMASLFDTGSMRNDYKENLYIENSRKGEFAKIDLFTPPLEYKAINYKKITKD
jgi:hypothetical protein